VSSSKRPSEAPNYQKRAPFGPVVPQRWSSRPAPGGQSVRVVKEPGGRLCHFENRPALAKSSRAEAVGTREGQFRKMAKRVIKMTILILDSGVLKLAKPCCSLVPYDSIKVIVQRSTYRKR
jgi:hypothetical protein